MAFGAALPLVLPCSWPHARLMEPIRDLGQREALGMRLRSRWRHRARRAGLIPFGAAVCVVVLRSATLLTDNGGPAGADGTGGSSVPPLQLTTTEPRRDPTTTTSTTINPCQHPDDGPRPENGTELRAPSDGEGVFEVDNGTALDAEVKLFVADASKEVVVDVYVRARQRASVARVPTGSYTVAYAQGRVWDEAATHFTCDRRAQKFDEDHLRGEADADPDRDHPLDRGASAGPGRNGDHEQDGRQPVRHAVNCPRSHRTARR